jgi:ferredoxin
MSHATVAVHTSAARPPLTPAVGVFLCRCAASWRPAFDAAIDPWLARPGPAVTVVIRDDLCRAPDRAVEPHRQAALQGAVIAACAERAGLAALLRRVGLRPWAIDSLDLAVLADLAGDSLPVARQLDAAVIRLRARLRASSEHVAVAYGLPGERGDRRALLRALLAPTYRLLPAVDGQRCQAGRGCRLCLQACPARALRLQAGRLTVHADACTACGACLTACPARAIAWPGQDMADLDAQLGALLDVDGASQAPPLILTCAGRLQTPPPRGAAAGPRRGAAAVLALPCAAGISPALLLRAVERGAPRVEVRCCAGVCPQGHDRGRIRRTVGVALQVLTAFGLGHRRLALVEGAAEGDAVASAALTAASAPVPLGRDGPPQGYMPSSGQDLRLPAILGRLRAASGSSAAVIAGDDVPGGQVRVQGEGSCTLCGVCTQVCPTQALTLAPEAQAETLRFSHARCVGCGLCVDSCPEHVLRLERVLDLDELAGPPRVLACAEVVRCRRCHQPIAPASMLARVQQALGARAPDGRWHLQRWCAGCRLALSLSVPPEAWRSGRGA